MFQTPPLCARQTYRSGSGGFMSDPGTQTTPPSTISQYTTRVASGGVWPLSRVNPDLPTQCGLKVALCGLKVAFVVDLSASVQGSVTALKSAADSFVDALRGTPSQAALFTFSTDSPAVNAGPNSGLMPVATTADANRFKQLYSGWTESTANGYTNWDRGLGAVAAVNESDDTDEHFDLTIVLTDGNPTAFGPQGPGYPQPAGFTRFREMENAIASANRVKAEDTRIVSVGVGDGLDQGATANLRAISGRTAYDGTDIAEADFIQAADYAEVGRDLHDLVLSACAPSISVIKQIVPHGGTADDAYTPAEGWQFTAEPDNPAVTVTPTVKRPPRRPERSTSTWPSRPRTRPRASPSRRIRRPRRATPPSPSTGRTPSASTRARTTRPSRSPTPARPDSTSMSGSRTPSAVSSSIRRPI
ncbi:vWA domain-containing protein [Streptomyces malaysiensis]|uniref:vWA domain-containing protein n=1 Tax=Streptomyces malaysiensis TaxID=92644 RepID=UPI00142ECDEC|nr:vWA domain-containing protein [Streptomyces malaysiensis]